jgi:hypothetical protein
LPSVSATGGASSVSASSSGGGDVGGSSSIDYETLGARMAHSTNTMWVATNGVTSTRGQGPGRVQDAGPNGSSSAGEATTVNSPDAAA